MFSYMANFTWGQCFFSDACSLLANFCRHTLFCGMQGHKGGLDQNCDIRHCDVFINTKHVLEDRGTLQPCSFHKGMLWPC